MSKFEMEPPAFLQRPSSKSLTELEPSESDNPEPEIKQSSVRVAESLDLRLEDAYCILYADRKSARDQHPFLGTLAHLVKKLTAKSKR